MLLAAAAGLEARRPAALEDNLGWAAQLDATEGEGSAAEFLAADSVAADSADSEGASEVVAAVVLGARCQQQLRRAWP